MTGAGQPVAAGIRDAPTVEKSSNLEILEAGERFTLAMQTEYSSILRKTGNPMIFQLQRNNPSVISS